MRAEGAEDVVLMPTSMTKSGLVKNIHLRDSGLVERRISAAALARLIGTAGLGGASRGPTYEWLADRIERFVADGRLVHDTRLPSERDAAAALGLSRTTVTHAYAVLREHGFLEARRGSGSRIRIPGGPVRGGGEPVSGVRGGFHHEGGLNLTNTAPPAIEGLGDRFADASRHLAAYTQGGGYYRDGIPELREALAERYTARGVATTPDQILVTTGALAGMAATALALLARSDGVAVEPSGYPNALASLRSRGVRFLPVTESSDERLLDLEALADQFTHRPPKAMLLVADFHNPTGRLLSNADRARIARLWARHAVIGIVDETLADLWLDEDPAVRPMAAFAPDCITVGSASKTYWGGLRLGWVRAPARYLGAIAAARVTLDLGAPVLEQLVLARLLRERPGLDDVRRVELAARRVRLREAIIRECPGWSCDLPSGGLSLWWRLPSPSSSAIVAEASRRGLALAPGSAFSLDGRGFEARLRTPFTLPDDDLSRAATVLGEVNRHVTSPGRLGSPT